MYLAVKAEPQAELYWWFYDSAKQVIEEREYGCANSKPFFVKIIFFERGKVQVWEANLGPPKTLKVC